MRASRRTGEIGKDDVGGATGVRCVRDIEPDAGAATVEHPVLACIVDSVWIEIDPPRGRCSQTVRREREHAGSRTDVEHSAILERETLQDAQAQARRLVMTRAEAHGGPNDDDHIVCISDGIGTIPTVAPR